MTKKQKIIVSTTGIFLVLLILVGLTYAYFLTRIKGNTNEKSISVSTANLILEYADIEDIVVGGENVEPGTTWTKKFSATNKGSKKVEYGVALENVLNTLERTKDLVYTLNCTSSLGTDCNKVETETEFPVIGTILITNNIEPEEVQSYELIVSYKEQNEDQSVDMNKKIYAKANIVDPKTFNVYEKSQLNNIIIASARNASNNSDSKRTSYGSEITAFDSITWTKYYDEFTTSYEETNPSITYWQIADTFNDIENNNTTKPTTITEAVGKYINISYPDYKIVFLESYNETTQVATFKNLKVEYEKVLNNAPDDYGTSYYYRGNPQDNYVSFAGLVWRIVRINGDGTVRIILDDEGIKTAFNSYENVYADNAGVGYMYGTPGSDTYLKTHENINSSTVKQVLDSWYEENIENNTLHYEKYLADTLFCGDKSLADKDLVQNDGTGLGYGKNKTYYKKTENSIKLVENVLTLKCANYEDNNYSKYTSKLENNTTINDKININNDLKHPIGLISFDEVVYAGFNGKTPYGFNYGYYLYRTDFVNYVFWSMTPSVMVDDNTYVYTFNKNINFATTVSKEEILNQRLNTIIEYRARPVINLRSDLLISSGDGTETNPYQVKLPTE